MIESIFKVVFICLQVSLGIDLILLSDYYEIKSTWNACVALIKKPPVRKDFFRLMFLEYKKFDPLIIF